METRRFRGPRAYAAACASILALTLFLELCLAQEPQPTIPWPDDGEHFEGQKLCRAQTANCCDDMVQDCTSAEVYCGEGFEVWCYGKKLLQSRGWGYCDLPSLGGNCYYYDKYFCCIHRLYEEASCLTSQCYLGTSIANACDPAWPN